MADLDEIMSGSGGDSVVDNTAPVEQPAREDRRDEQGRFASQQPQEPAGYEKQGTETERPPSVPDGFIPIQALDARLAKQQERFEARLAEERNAWQRQMTAFQPPKPVEPVKPPDFFENPDAAVDFRLKQALDPLQNSQMQMVEKFSKALAIKDYGQEAVDAAVAAISDRVNRDPNGTRFDYQRIMSSDLPYDTLVKWHKQQNALSTYGDDPAAYREKLRAELMAEMQGGQQQQAPQTQQPVMPTSFAGARNAGPSTTPGFSGPLPLSEIMNGR